MGGERSQRQEGRHTKTHENTQRRTLWPPYAFFFLDLAAPAGPFLALVFCGCVWVAVCVSLVWGVGTTQTRSNLARTQNASIYIKMTDDVPWAWWPWGPWRWRSSSSVGDLWVGLGWVGLGGLGRRGGGGLLLLLLGICGLGEHKSASKHARPIHPSIHTPTRTYPHRHPQQGRGAPPS